MINGNIICLKFIVFLIYYATKLQQIFQTAKETAILFTLFSIYYKNNLLKA